MERSVGVHAVWRVMCKHALHRYAVHLPTLYCRRPVSLPILLCRILYFTLMHIYTVFPLTSIFADFILLLQVLWYECLLYA